PKSARDLTRKRRSISARWRDRISRAVALFTGPPPPGVLRGDDSRESYQSSGSAGNGSLTWATLGGRVPLSQRRIRSMPDVVHIGRGKVREIYALDDERLLLVAS